MQDSETAQGDDTRPHQARVGLPAGMTRDPDAAEDLTQETVLRALRAGGCQFETDDRGVIVCDPVPGQCDCGTGCAEPSA